MRAKASAIYVAMFLACPGYGRAQMNNNEMPVFTGTNDDHIKSIETARQDTNRLVNFGTEVERKLVSDKYFLDRTTKYMGKLAKHAFELTQQAIDGSLKTGQENSTNSESRMADNRFQGLEDSVKANEGANRDYSDPSTDTLGDTIKKKNCQNNPSSCAPKPPDSPSSTSDDQKVTEDRARYNDKKLCRRSLIICSHRGLTGLITGQNIFSDTKTCANSVFDPTASTGLRAIGVVIVKCVGQKAQILRQMTPTQYVGPEVGLCSGGYETCFQGRAHSSYCVPCD